MPIEHLIIQYGYLALFAGTFFEGETALILGGFAAHQGYLDLTRVIALSFIAGILGDHTFFCIGRCKGREFLEKRAGWAEKAEKVNRLLEQHQKKVMLSSRFLYGLRIVTPFVIGMTKVRYATYFLFDAIGAALWATLFALSGFYFGHSLEILLKDVKRYEQAGFVALAAGGIIFFILKKLRQRKTGVASRFPLH